MKGSLSCAYPSKGCVKFQPFFLLNMEAVSNLGEMHAVDTGEKQVSKL